MLRRGGGAAVRTGGFSWQISGQVQITSAQGMSGVGGNRTMVREITLELWRGDGGTKIPKNVADVSCKCVLDGRNKVRTSAPRASGS